METAVATGDTACEVRRRVRRERHDQGHHQHPVAIEVSADDPWAQGQRSDRDDRHKADAECSHARHDGLAALPDGAAVSQCPGQFLFERQKETGREGERGDPETGDRLHRLVAAEGDLGDLQEQVRR